MLFHVSLCFCLTFQDQFVNMAIKGLQIWAQSYCRSTLAFYAALAKYYQCPFRICTGSRGQGRNVYGWDPEEFSSYDIVHTDYDQGRCLHLYEEKKDWHQIFGIYQKTTTFSSILKQACESSPGVGVVSEAPLNMFKPGLKRIIKNGYLRSYLPLQVGAVVKNTDFFVNFSGDFASKVLNPGWPEEKIVSAGYYPPPLQDSQFIQRRSLCGKEDKRIIFVSGGASWHRGTGILPDSLKGMEGDLGKLEIIFAGAGPEVDRLRAKCLSEDLPVRFVGFLDMPELIRYYQICDVFLALGREEPWGIRVNDALYCGAPLIVGTGMGASKIVKDFGCGWVFDSGDARSLAKVMSVIFSNSADYVNKALKVQDASLAYHPDKAGALVGETLSRRFSNWKRDISPSV